jgi:hypothetical protein
MMLCRGILDSRKGRRFYKLPVPAAILPVDDNAFYQVLAQLVLLYLCAVAEASIAAIPAARGAALGPGVPSSD